MQNGEVLLVKEKNSILTIIYEKMRHSLQIELTYDLSIVELVEIAGCAFDQEILIIDPAISQQTVRSSIYISANTQIVPCDTYAYITQNEELLFLQIEQLYREQLNQLTRHRLALETQHTGRGKQ